MGLPRAHNIRPGCMAKRHCDPLLTGSRHPTEGMGPSSSTLTALALLLWVKFVHAPELKHTDCRCPLTSLP